MTEMMADSTQTEERYQPVAFDPTIHAAKKRKADLPTTHWRTSSLRWGPCSMHARMAAHARAVLTGTSVSVPVGAGRLLLGTWQGIYLWEHRTVPHTRSIVVTVVG